MRFRDNVALTLPALILRIVLAITFLWAGLGKIMGEHTVTGDNAARLANMGVNLQPVEVQGTLERELPEPAEDTPDTPAEEQPDPEVPADALPDANPDAEPPTELIIPRSDDESPAADEPTQEDPQASAERTFQWTTVQSTAGTFTASDFPGEYTAQRVTGIALLISRAGNPGFDAESNRLANTLPAKLASGRLPMSLAWAAAVTEILAAVLLFFGVLTRFGSMMLIGVMLTAIWLTNIGPAAMGNAPAYLGFIPAAEDPWAPASYATLLWQLACLAMASAVFLLGSGPIGFDRALFRPAERLERTESGSRERSTFDRGPNDTP